ncbi:hypothetical protein BKA66DRAFT_186830 [Pyrenochaeta sp. MPI-SDFR-AT-0127]|nr:hypothetical protein BKA66DRAFT_186830 [Pyrenochaeta sp. MPI-SDFR-AT-0127]
MSGTRDAESEVLDCPTLHSPHHDATAVDIVCIHGLQDPVPPWGKPAGQHTPTVTVRELSWTYNGILQSSAVTGWSDTSEVARNLLQDIAVQREQSRRLTVPLIWITNGSTRCLTSKVLQQADQIPNRCADSRTLLSTYSVGLIILNKHLSTRGCLPLIVLSQLVTCAYLWCYSLTMNHHVVTSGQRMVSQRSALYLQVSNYLASTTTFVFVAIAWGILAMVQYHIQRSDHYQRLCLLLGLVGGLFMGIFTSSATTAHAPRFALHSFALTTTVALASSACSHWIWRNFFSTQESRLERKLQAWSKEAYKMDPATHVIKVHEIL